MERLSTNRRPAGITVNALRTWGVLFLVIGIALIIATRPLCKRWLDGKRVKTGTE